MDVREAIKTRRSVKKYLDKAVPDNIIGSIVEAGSLAPSAGNKQPWKFIVIKDPDTRENVARHCKEQYWMTKAPVHIAVVSDESMMEKFYGKRAGFYSVQSCSAAAENMLIMAHGQGLGACWVSGFDDMELANDLGLPSGSRVQVVMTLGYPTKEIRRKTTRPLNEVLYLGSYGGKIATLAPFIYDWSTIVSDHVEVVKKDLEKVLSKEFSDYLKKTKTNISKLAKKIVDDLRRQH
ncbi:MAG: nitroreductase family protein [Nanoarchaeota archaeon]